MNTKLIFAIVIILIAAFIGVMVVPNLKFGATSANEAKAVAMLHMLAYQNQAWKNKEMDGNGAKDFWTMDVSCLYRIVRRDGKERANLISRQLALADGAPYSRDNPMPLVLNRDANDLDDWGSTPELAREFTTTPYAGYFFRAMLTDETGLPYNQNPVGKNKVKACNTDKFAFVAYPAKYPDTGVNTYIVNERNLVYGADRGSSEVILQWPAEPPTAISSIKWSSVD
ncbi:MAG: DUF2950 family protein [Candidatus Brocadiia bacterium]